MSVETATSVLGPSRRVVNTSADDEVWSVLIG
jgi:hypothetical protein